MGFCTNCGSTVPEEAKFCVRCGIPVASKTIAATAGGTTIEVTVSPGPTWHVTYATGQTGGPFTEDEIRSMIARQQIKITDSVAVSGGTGWVPITQSPFARYIVAQASVDRLAASTCPRCGAAMVAVVHQSSMATILIIVGIICTVFVIGIVFIIIGVMMRRKGRVRYQCPRCNYRA